MLYIESWPFLFRNTPQIEPSVEEDSSPASEISTDFETTEAQDICPDTAETVSCEDDVEDETDDDCPEEDSQKD